MAPQNRTLQERRDDNETNAGCVNLSDSGSDDPLSDEADDKDHESLGKNQSLGQPPGLKRLKRQRRRKRRADRVSLCVSKCRSSVHAVEQAATLLRWEQIKRETPEVSAAWLEATDSTIVFSPFQVVSKIGGMLDACRKADLAAFMQTMQRLFPEDYDFIPQTWIVSNATLPQVADLEKTMADRAGTYICKPTAGALGRGVRLVQSFSELRGMLTHIRGSADRMRPAEYVVQRYVDEPLLIDGIKFDCRCYAVVTSVVPLRAYLFEEGLARFCTVPYERPRGRNLSCSCMHLTNYAVNKHNTTFDCTQAHDRGSKRALSSVFAAIESAGGPSAESLWDKVRALTEKTLLALRPRLVENIARGTYGKLHPLGPKSFHILGLDIILDEHYRPFLLELNASSSLNIHQPASEPSDDNAKEISQLDSVVKTELIAQAWRCANPLPHGTSLKRRISWLEEVGQSHRAPSVNPLKDEVIPLDDDGQPVDSMMALCPCIPDQAGRCPALRQLDFEAYPGPNDYMRVHLKAFGIWRHYALQTLESLPAGLVGFGQDEFLALCQQADLIASDDVLTGSFCWPDQLQAALFADSVFLKSDHGPNSEIRIKVFDFPLFLHRVAAPLGELLTAGHDAAPESFPMQAFVDRVLPTLGRTI